MSIKRLDIYNVRNIHEQSIYPSSKFNFIVGKNASGKTALLEAIYLLGRAKSFRSSSIKSVINFSQPRLTVSSEILSETNQSVQVGVQMDGKDIEIRINQQSNQKRVQLAYALPMQIIHPKSFELLDSTSQLRREYLDWGIFNHDNSFLADWRKYKKTLMQRNALLKLKTTNQIRVWDKELVNYGTMVNAYREHYLDTVKPVLNKIADQLLNLTDLEVRLYPGWQVDKGFQINLHEHLAKDMQYGFTHCGPHRGDIQVMFKNKLAKEVLSRGQLKILVICLKLAQVELIKNSRNYFGCILIDDFSAELDGQNREKILQYLSEMNVQVFISSTETDDFTNLRPIGEYTMFHVEQGKIEEIDVSCGTSL